jgi:phosphoenolpyruvate phosphomutase
MIAERACVDGLWASGLGISTVHGLPDAGLVTMTELAAATAYIRGCSGLPLIADCDAGFGDVNVVQRMVGLFEDAGADAVCIEDKQYPKRNSFLDGHLLADPEAFAYKIWAAKNAQKSGDFAVVARLESLIAGQDVDEALERAEVYLDAGADALLIHSKSRTVDEVGRFVTRARAMGCSRPIFVVPTTYYQATADTLATLGVSAAIYANQLLRATITAMTRVLDVLERDACTTRLEPEIASVYTVLDMCGTGKLLADVPPAPHHVPPKPLDGTDGGR